MTAVPRIAVEAVTDDPHLELAFAWADEKPDDRGYVEVIAAFLAMCRAISQYQAEQAVRVAAFPELDGVAAP